MNKKENIKISKKIYCCLKVLEDYCEYHEYSEVASPMKPIIKYAEKLVCRVDFSLPKYFG